MTTTHTFNVAMTCDGCAGAVKRVLAKLDGIENVDINVADKTVKVTTALDAETVLAQIKKTGKETSLA
eukprot:CFRG4210T1